MVNSHLLSYVVPKNLNSNWNIGFILGILFVMQIMSGFLLTFNYVPYGVDSFESVIDLFFDVNFGWAFRYFHAQCVSFCFVFMFFHVLKGLWYSSRYLPWSWYSGMVILVLSMAIAFLGYVLPNGQMSYWGATVITNLFYWANDFVTLLLGGFSVGTDTIQRFYILHFILPFVLLFIIVIHIYFLHRCSSTNPLSCIDSVSVVRFYPIIIFSDLRMLVMLFVILSLQLGYGIIPLFQGDCDNSIMSNPLQTPLHIVPEWYLLVFYATLKLLPSKLSGLIAMAFMLELIIILVESRSQSSILSFPVYHRMCTMNNMIMIPSIFVIGCIGRMVMNDPILKLGIVLVIFIFVSVLNNLDYCSIRR